MKFINVTGEEIVYFKTDGTKETIPPIGGTPVQGLTLQRTERLLLEVYDQFLAFIYSRSYHSVAFPQAGS